MNHSTRPFFSASLLLAASLFMTQPALAQPDSDTQTPQGSSYYPNGMLKQKVEQTRSRRTDRSFYPSGIMQREQIWAMNGSTPVKERDVTFSPAGVMLREQRWAAGEPISDLEYLVSGLLVSRKDYSGMGSTRELLVQNYFSSGVLASEERFSVSSRGGLHPIGVQKKFDVSGTPISEQVYDEQGKFIEEKVRSSSGQLLPVR
jgi:antitoxin component YwqK of YwqJK toxin-antitoxin module